MKTNEEFEAEQNAISDNKLAEMAHRALSKLCDTGGRSFTMTVPPRIDDTDMVIAELIKRFKFYAAQHGFEMPTEAERNNAMLNYCANPTEDGGVDFDQKQANAFWDGIEWLRSRLTCSEKPNNSQKTEGGAK